MYAKCALPFERPSKDYFIMDMASFTLHVLFILQDNARHLYMQECALLTPPPTVVIPCAIGACV